MPRTGEPSRHKMRRFASVASSTMQKIDRNSLRSPLSRSRRKTFSSPMMASSTTTLIEMSMPPRVIVLREAPIALSTMRAVNRESGKVMEGNECAAQICKEGEQHKNHEHATDEERLVDVLDRGLNKACGPE